MPLVTEVGLGPGHIVTWAPAPPKEHSSFSARIYCGQMAGWIKMLLGMDVGLVPGNIVLDGDWGPSSPPIKGAQQPPLFGP